jgi:hypothetical protein
MEILLPLLLIPLFPLLWVGVTSLTAIVGGWYGLAKSYPMPKVLNEMGVKFSFQSLRIGFFGNYRSSLNITVYNQGISMAPMFIFSMLHKPVYIGYNSMADVVIGKFIVNYVSFTLGNRKIKIWGRSVIKMKECINRDTQR